MRNGWHWVAISGEVNLNIWKHYLNIFDVIPKLISFKFRVLCKRWIYFVIVARNGITAANEDQQVGWPAFISNISIESNKSFSWFDCGSQTNLQSAKWISVRLMDVHVNVRPPSGLLSFQTFASLSIVFYPSSCSGLNQLRLMDLNRMNKRSALQRQQHRSTHCLLSLVTHLMSIHPRSWWWNVWIIKWTELSHAIDLVVLSPCPPIIITVLFHYCSSLHITRCTCIQVHLTFLSRCTQIARNISEDPDPQSLPGNRWPQITGDGKLRPTHIFRAINISALLPLAIVILLAAAAMRNKIPEYLKLLILRW